ncbi:MAG: hypothetical protein DWG76_00035 [Chloroflexi bacterium]|nr:hypothetical protein [Chloroflexota bacterium]
MRSKVAFITSLSHSGSTLLDLLLGAHPRIIGLGEIFRVIDSSPQELASEKRMVCSCGDRVGDCAFWKPTVGRLEKLGEASSAQRYQAVLESFERVFGEGYVLVDSSKYPDTLKMVNSLETIDLKAIHLIKDVRGFTVSQREALDPELKYGFLPRILNSIPLSRLVYSVSIKQPLYLFLKWYLRNKDTERILQDLAIEQMHLSYEELCAQPQTIMEAVFRFLEVPALAETPLAPNKSHSHIFMGNQMIADEKKMAEIKYDDRWTQQEDWRRAAKLLPFVMRYNRAVVYNNLNEPELAP